MRRLRLWWPTLVLGLLLVTMCGCGRKKSNQVASANSSSSSASDSSSSPTGSSGSSLPDKQRPRRGVGIWAVRDRVKVQGKFENLGKAFAGYATESGRSPANADVLLEERYIDKETYDWIKEGYIVVYWNVQIDRLAEPSKAILAYENADVPVPGAFVVTANGNVMRMMPNQIETAPKAGTLPDK